MGNHPSSSNSDSHGSDRHGHRERSNSNGSGLPNIGLLRRGPSNSLGLSRSELDKMCKPSGLYPTCTWDDRSIRRLIGDGKIAPRLPGNETILEATDKECPICFLNYCKVNETSCCKANICTECYLQVKPMNDKNAACPFCNTEKFTVKLLKVSENLDKLMKIEEEEEEEELVMGKRKNKEPKEGEFGSSLSRVRSESLTSSELSEECGFAMSPEERKRIEDQMRQQYNHPLARRMDSEAEERRIQHDQTYRRTHSDRIRRTRGLLSRGLLNSRGRNWNQMMRAFEQNNHNHNHSNGEEGRVQTLDDLVVLEAALLLSMEQEATRRRTRGRGSNEDGEAPENLRSSFPTMLHAIMARRAAESGRREDDDTDDEEESSHPRRIHRHRQGRRDRFPGMSAEAGATAALLLRGVSEEEQMEMAIAASLRESQQQENGSNDTNDTNNTNASEDHQDTGNGNGNESAAPSSASPGSEAVTDGN